MKRATIVILMVLAAVTIPFAVTGCNNEDVATFKLALAQAEADMAKIQADVAALPDGPEKEKAKELLTLVKSRVESLNSRLKEIEDTPGLIQSVTSEIGTAVPGVVGSWIALGGIALASILRAAQNRAAARQIVASVDTILSDEQKATITGQSATAKRIVDEAQGTKARLPV